MNFSVLCDILSNETAQPPDNPGDLKTDLVDVCEYEKLYESIAQLENELYHGEQFKKQMEVHAKLKS